MGQSRFLLALMIAACGRLDFALLPPDAADTPDAPPVAPALAISVSYIDACAIDHAGKLWCWGSDDAGELGDSQSVPFEAPVQVMSDLWREVATGGVVGGQAFSCAIRGDGTLWCFGENSDGELGIGTTTPTLSPMQVGTDTWQHVATGIDCNACAIRDDGSLWCWGSGTSAGCGGALPNGAAADALAPIEIDSGSWLDVTIGYGNTCAIRADHTLWCSGYGDNYALGNASNALIPTPIQIGTESSWSRVWLSSKRGCGLRDDGSLWCWGDNSFGQAGDGTTTPIMVPEAIAPGMTWIDVGVADDHTCAIDGNHALWCWGNPNYIAFGIDQSTIITTPLEIDSSGAWTAISCGDVTTCGIRDGIVVCVGQDQFAQLGNGGNYQPQPVALDEGWHAFAGGYQHMCGLQLDDTVACWGRAGHGMLGQDAIDQIPVEVSTSTWSAPLIAGNGNVCANSAGAWWCWGNFPDTMTTIEPPAQQTGYAILAVGEGHACGIRADGTLWCWGDNLQGDLGVTGGNGTPMQVGSALWRSVAAGDTVTCAIETNGTLWCWGVNNQLQCGQTVGASFTTPVQVDGATDWSQVYSGPSASTMCAIKSNGTLFCWGSDIEGQAGDNGQTLGVLPTQVTAATDWSDISVGAQLVCGMRSGTVWCWGNRTAPTAVTNASFVQVVTTTDSICALDNTSTRWCWGDDSIGELGDGRVWTTAFAPVPLPP